MSVPIEFGEEVLRAICRVLGDTEKGLKGYQIGELLESCRIDDPEPHASKRNRLFCALWERQLADGSGNATGMLIVRAMNPVEYLGRKDLFDQRRRDINEALGFAGLRLREDGKLAEVTRATTLSAPDPGEVSTKPREAAHPEADGHSGPTPPVNVIHIERMYGSQIQQGVAASIDRSAAEDVGSTPGLTTTAMPGSDAAASLTGEQASDYERLDYRCRDKVHVSGTVPMKRSNIVRINGCKVRIPDRVFRVLVRLLVELKKGQGGWVHRQAMAPDDTESGEAKYQVFSDLRSKVEGSLHVKNAETFIQCDGSGRYRVSTHPDFVTYDREKLINHPDVPIHRLAKKLP